MQKKDKTNYKMLKAIKARYGTITAFAEDRDVRIPPCTVSRWVKGNSWPKNASRQKLILDKLGIDTPEKLRAA